MSSAKKISQESDTIPVATPSESVSARVLSSEDSNVADLVKEQPTLEQINSMKVKEYKQPNLLELPEECAALQGKQYRFAWLSKGKDLQVALRTRGWILCNATNSPYIKKHRFGIHGGVEQGGMLLAFMREDQYVAMERIPAQISADRVKHFTKDIFENQDKDAPISFYKPEDDAKE